MDDFDLLDLLAVKRPDQAFLAFHGDNPHVFQVLEDACRRFVDAYGVRRTSVDYLVHFARYERIIGTQMSGIAGDYKIANQHTAFYARLLLDRHPEWDGLFATRRSVADDDKGWLRLAA